jgi:basic membrane protein A
MHRKIPCSRFLTTMLAVALIGVLLVPAFTSCARGSGAAMLKKNVLNVGVILGSGGLGDKSFNDSAYSGLLEAQKEFNIRFETVNFGTAEANLDALRLFARNNYDLIVGVAFENMQNIQTVAGEYPNLHFAIIDAELQAGNVTSIVYREQEGDFLMGVLAAMITRTKYVGVVGGTDIPAIRRIMSGFKQGVSYQDASVRSFADFAGTFSDPQAGLILALSRYGEGADVIHNAASKTGLGIIQAAQQVNKWVTGTSGDQRYLAPGNMLGNRPKRVDTAVRLVIQEESQGAFRAGVRSLGLKENGISLGPFDETVVTAPVTKRLEELRQKIVSGEIQILAE